MLIEVVKSQEAPNTEKGDLLEDLAEHFLKIQGYEVTKQIRITASELDLLCKHKISGKQVYIECKAQRETLSANVLTNILGKVDFHDLLKAGLSARGL